MAEHRRYTKRQKVVAITSALASSVTAAAETAGVPESTLRYWMDAPEFAELRSKTRQQIAEGSILLAQLAQDAIAAKIRAGEVDAKDLAVIYGIAIDKGQLLAGAATDRVEHRELGVFDDHETAQLVDAARRYLEGDTAPEGAPVVEDAAVVEGGPQ